MTTRIFDAPIGGVGIVERASRRSKCCPYESREGAMRGDVVAGLFELCEIVDCPAAASSAPRCHPG
jgi:hypothetical protein